MDFTTFYLNGLGFLMLFLIFLFSVFKFYQAKNILRYLQNEYSFFYKHIAGSEDSPSHFITSGRFFPSNFVFLFSSKYAFDAFLKKALRMYRVVAFFRLLFVAVLMYILFELGILKIPAFV